MKLPSAKQMHDLDQLAISNYHIPSIVLMENAGVGTVLMAERQLGSCEQSFAPIFVGPGNNGGDGLVIGRHLHQRGCHPLFFLLTPPEKLQGDAAINLEIVSKLGLELHRLDSAREIDTISFATNQWLARGFPCYAIFDAIFGIGLCRDVVGHYAETIRLMNSPEYGCGAPVISVDIPSGLNSDTGEVQGICVQADYCASYGCPQPGHYLQDGTILRGRLEIIDIGIPPEAIVEADITTELASSSTVAAMAGNLYRNHTSHKGSHGHLLVLGGSSGKTGAPILTAKGALRSGAGLVTLTVPEDLNPIFETSLAEAMTVVLEGSGSSLSVDHWPLIQEQIATKAALVVGPGLGEDATAAELVLRIFHEVACPVVFDADALNILASHRASLKKPGGARIYTPHPGELRRLLGISTREINGDRIAGARRGCALFANSDHQSILVLKGAGTVIASSEGSLFINSSGNPGMATGGMGDVLSGGIGALICQGLTAMEAAITGVYLHGAAADIVQGRMGVGYFASEVADAIPEARRQLLTNSESHPGEATRL